MRVAVIGTSGSGKSTFARALAGRVGAPHVELDAINWQAGWRDLNTHDHPEFRRRVAQALAPPAWVSDGNYSAVRDLVLERATHLVWLDYSRWVIMPRVIRRSFRRVIDRSELWPGTGNREDFRRWLDKDHPIRWAWDNFARRRVTFSALFDDAATAHLERCRLRHPREARPLLDRLAASATLRKEHR